MDIKKFIIIFYLALSGVIAAESEDPVYKEDIISLEGSIGVASDQVIIQYLEKNKKIPIESWKKVIQSVMKPNHEKLRSYIYLRFSTDVELFEEQTDLQDAFLKLCKSEIDDFISKEMPTQEEIQRTILVLRNIKKRKMSSLLSETGILTAYSLFEIRKEANEALFEIKDDRILPIILNLSQSQNPVERTYAVDTLYYLKDERTIPVLISLLNDKNKSVRYYAIKSLDAMNSTEAIPYYIRILRSDANDEVRILSARVLGKMKPPAAFNSILDTVYDANPELRNVILDALFGYNFSAAAPYVSRQLAQEESKSLKIKEIRLLISLNNSGYMTGLNKILKDEDDIETRIWGIYATGVIGDPAGYENLLENLGYKNADVREEAALALANFKYKKSLPYLLKILEDPKEKYSVQAAALIAIKSLDDNSSIPSLFEDSLEHKDVSIRAELKVLLREMLYRRFR